MKYTRKFIYTAIIAAVLTSGCNKDKFKELNINPQAAPTIDVNFLFTSAQLGAASGGSQGDNRYIDWRTNIGMASTATQHLASTGGISNVGDKYQENGETNAAPWDFIYRDIRNFAEIIRQTDPGGYAEGKNNNTRQAARIMRAFSFHRITDFYGSIPYSEALKAQEGIFFPAYQKQKEIYLALLKELEEAATAITTTADPDFAAADLYYAGNADKWKRFAYSLMLRLAMRVSNVDAATANTYVSKAVAGGVFQSNADNVLVPMDEGPSLWSNQNGISRAMIPADGGEVLTGNLHISKTMMDFLKGPNAGSTADDDPRLMIYTSGIGTWTSEAAGFVPINTDPLQQKGMPNGYDLNQLRLLEGNPTLNPQTTYSKINVKLLDRKEPYMLINYGEVKLLLAEAAQRGIGGLTAAAAKAHYDEGVKASMQMWTVYDASFVVSDAQVAAYLAARPYNVYKPALEMIGEQLWANKFLNWWEAWADWRRTGFPKLTPTNYPGNVTGGRIPQRLMYPSGEVASNPNFKTGASANDFVTKLWWAGGPE